MDSRDVSGANQNATRRLAVEQRKRRKFVMAFEHASLVQIVAELAENDPTVGGATVDACLLRRGGGRA